jgi:hypothetical protein
MAKSKYLIMYKVLVSALMLLVVARAQAHHSFAMYDNTKLVQIRGVVKEFQWTNPHALLWINQDPEDGAAAVLWTMELPTSPGNLARMGWSKHSLKPGDKVLVDINPLRDGKHGGSFKKVTLPDGKVLTASATPPRDGGSDAAHDDHDEEHDEAASKKGGSCACDLAANPSRPTPIIQWLSWLGLAVLFTRMRKRSETGRF